MTPHAPEDILARWQADEAAARARQQTEPGIASPALLAGKTRVSRDSCNFTPKRA